MLYYLVDSWAKRTKIHFMSKARHFSWVQSPLLWPPQCQLQAYSSGGHSNIDWAPQRSI